MEAELSESDLERGRMLRFAVVVFKMARARVMPDGGAA